MLHSPASRIKVMHGDSRDILKTLDAESIDSCVCDPPYALVSIGKRFGKPGAAPAKGNDAYMRASRGFMNQSWDSGETAFDPDFWREVLRVMKPGAHLLAFGGTRSYHRLACAIEDAGAEIRDCIFYCYGSGFPKSLDVSKQIDKAAGAQREIVGRHTGRKATPCCDIRGGSYVGGVSGGIDCSAITAPATDAAREWQGWGTALKPAHEILCVAQKPLSPNAELICLARKPLSETTIAANVLRHGVGALNISASRVHPDTTDRLLSRARRMISGVVAEFGNSTFGIDPSPNADEFARKLGRLLSDEAVGLLSVGRVSANGGSGLSPPNSQDHCQVCRHFCDALALLALVSDQPPPLQSLCARIHNRPSMHGDDQAGGQLDSLLYECMIHLANLDCAFLSDREKSTHLLALSRAVAKYLVSCLHCTETLPQGQSNFALADKAARWLVRPYEKTASGSDSSDEGLPTDKLLFNILFGPYLITNTADLLIQTIERRGRWPANLCHDNSDEVLAAFPDTASGTISPHHQRTTTKTKNTYGERAALPEETFGDSGSAARFFASFPCEERDLKRFHYSSKADGEDRLGSGHPTVKPVDLICWLIRLVTPKGGLVLDMFAGSGTTGEAAFREGMRCILMEREATYVTDIERRISLLMAGPDERARETVKASGKTADAGPLFGGLSENQLGGAASVRDVCQRQKCRTIGPIGMKR